MMQLPGFRDEPIRTTVDLTWWPSDDTFQVSTRLWIKDRAEDRWVLQDMAVYPTARRDDVPEQLSNVLTAAWSLVNDLSKG